LVGDPAYPSRLAEGWPDLDAPVLLAWRGEPPSTVGPGVAIVGARNATGYGTAVAELLATAVARAGGRVVSGGAVGIDAAAHAAALGLPGGTTVVLGCGHDVAYPVPHARRGGLFDRVLQDGGTLVSELLPEVTAHPGVIRARNRIVAGLAEVTIVVEGGGRSGALLTASAAADRGREVFAVPGDIMAPGSVAPLRLLAEGARACTGPADVLALMPAMRPTDQPALDPPSGGRRVVRGS
jgi:DNA processing protein